MRALLPHGCWIGGSCFREFELRTPDSEDDAFLVETAGMAVARRVNLLLARCVNAPGSNVDAMTAIRSLVAGDREALLLQLRQAAFGDELTSVLRCAKPECGAPLEINFRASELLLPPYAQPAETCTRAIEHEDGECEVSFRLPTAGDQEDAAELASKNIDCAARWILERCIQSIHFEGREIELDALAQSSLDKLAEIMAELDPQACVELKLTCPSCGSDCEAQLDTGVFLLRELDQRADEVLRDTHTLALCYHWSEAAILTMPPARRQRYLDLINAGTAATSQP